MSPSKFPVGAGQVSPVTRFDSAPTQRCAASVAVMLAGNAPANRGARLARSLGLPVAALPVNGERNLIECWIRRIAAAGFTGTVVLALSSEDEQGYYGQIVLPPSVELVIRRDTSPHRGAGGTLGDAWRECAASIDASRLEAGALVIEASNLPNFDFASFFRSMSQPADALIGAATDASPAGIMWLSQPSLGRIPEIGFLDLKEQLVSRIVDGGGRVLACIGATESCRICDRESYLRAIALLHASGARGQADGAVVEDGAIIRGASVICRGAVVERGALVVDAAVLPGARVCADAVVARSIVPPGSQVPCGYFVVDEIFGELGLATKAGTEGGAS